MLNKLPNSIQSLDQPHVTRKGAALRSPTRTLQLEDPVESIATTAVVSCLPGDTLGSAARLMWDHDCGALPVVDSSERVVGMLTDRDALMAAYTRGVELQALTVETVMSKTLYSCRPDESIGHALQLMRERQVRRLPVLTRAGRLFGIVSFADVARRLDRSPPASTELARALAGMCERPRSGAVFS
jgi:CBS-domain-containing membrane protein